MPVQYYVLRDDATSHVLLWVGGLGVACPKCGHTIGWRPATPATGYRDGMCGAYCRFIHVAGAPAEIEAKKAGVVPWT